jgi:16S rRNA G966 N2-methylase RsmD
MAKKRDEHTGELFIEESGQLRLLDKSAEQQAIEGGEVTCLGKTFPNDDERREYFLEELREKLKDPEFRQTPGFPKGTDEDILRLSDPPYYTACPNPFLGDLLRQSNTEDREATDYHREPYATDVSVGKNDRIYNAHSYPTKVPHLAIQKYVEHFTDEEDVVLDPFCGTGMTGVACALMPGERKAILCDLSPAATNIAHNYTAHKDMHLSRAHLGRAVDSLQSEYGWMYMTRHTGWPSSDRQLRHASGENPGRAAKSGTIQFVLWSDCFRCAHCAQDLVFWHEAASYEDAGLRDQFDCPNCGAKVSKKELDRTWTTTVDRESGQLVRQVERIPVLIQYEYGGKTFHKLPDDGDLKLIEKTNNHPIERWFPTSELHDGDKTSDPKSVGVTHSHHFYTRRNLAVMAAMWEASLGSPASTRPALQFLFTSTNAWATRMNRLLVSNFFKKRGGVIGQTLAGTLYISSVSIETNPIYRFSLRAKSASHTVSSKSVFVTTQSATAMQQIPGESIDYVFTDPPFGHNLVYSDLNYLWEAWLGVCTNVDCEAIVSRAQNRSLAGYERLMSQAFCEIYRVLKPGRWVTVEFHNSKNAVWRAIQQAMGVSGLIVANVSVLNKTHGTFNQVTATGAVKQDLAISAYKPSKALAGRFDLEDVAEESAWCFVAEHLQNVPVFVSSNSGFEVVAERTPQVLYDRMIAFHVQRGAAVPVSATEFFAGLSQRFPERDGMFLLPHQAGEYDRKRSKFAEPQQLSLYPSDEASAIIWLRQQLQVKPQTYQELAPVFMKEIHAWAKHEETVELRQILEQNFLCYDGAGPVPSQIHSYLSTNFKDLRNLDKEDPALVAKAEDRWYVPDTSKQGDLEKTREKQLLREFEEYRTTTKRKLKLFRTEAVRIGFKAAYDQQEYRTIIDVAHKLPDTVLQEDEKLLMYYDVALTRLGED